MRTETGIRFGFRYDKEATITGKETVRTTSWVENDLGQRSEQSIVRNIKDVPNKELARRKALKKALGTVFNKIQRAEVWNTYRLATKVPRWVN